MGAPGGLQRNENDEAMLRVASLDYFRSEPSSIGPFGESRLSWRAHARPPVQFRLSGGGLDVVVPLTGTRAVSPASSSTYSLTAFVPAMSRVLGIQSVHVETSACLRISVSEQEIASEVAAAVDRLLDEFEELSRRRDEVVELTSSDCSIKIRLKAAIPNIGDPDINVDARISLRARAGRLVHRIDEYRFEIDFPWWADLQIMSFFPAWLAVALAEGNQESLVRGRLNAGVQGIIDEKNELADAAGLAFLSAVARDDAFDLVVCPKLQA